jgi:hypothetical protein
MSLIPQDYRKTAFTHRIGLAVDRPEPDEVLEGTLYHSTDTGITERSNGIEWETYFSAGLSSSVFFYRADLTSTSMTDPGGGKMRWNNVTQTSATIFSFDWITDDGFDVHILFQLFASTTRFLIQSKDFALSYQQWELSAPATNMADWFTVPVTFVSSGGSGSFSHNERLAIIILPPSATVVI